ncbi:MAG: hypothetical protein WAO91_08545 [Candidatus Nitrosotenuis sp.]
MNAFVVFYVFIASLIVMIPIQSYSASASYVFIGNGYGTIGNMVQDAMIELALSRDGDKITFQSGQILLGNEIHTIKKYDMLYSKNNKSFTINAVTNDGITIKGKGKLVASNEGGLIYQLSGKTSKDNNSQKLAMYAMLMPQKTIKQTELDDKKDILLLVKHYDRVEWKNPYKFVVRTFDPALNPGSDFYASSGYLEKIRIHARVIDPLGSTIKVSDGITQKFGYYEDSVVIQDNARTGNYVLNVTASGENFKTVSKELTFVVIPLLPSSNATP